MREALEQYVRALTFRGHSRACNIRKKYTAYTQSAANAPSLAMSNYPRRNRSIR